MRQPAANQGWLFDPVPAVHAVPAPPPPMRERVRAGRPAPYQTRSATSRAAAEAIEARARGLRPAILGLIRKAGADGLTRSELQAAWADRHGRPLETPTACGRLNELENLGAIRKAGKRRAQTGSLQSIYVAVAGA